MVRRITNGVGTIPDNTLLAGTTVTSQTDQTVLISTGTDNLEDIIFRGGIAAGGVYWIYCPAATPKVAQLTGLYQISEVSGTYTFNIQLDRAMTGASGSAVSYVKGGITYSYLNDGGANGTVDGVIVKPGDSNNYLPYEKYSNRQQLHPVSYVDASSTDFFINEEI